MREQNRRIYSFENFQLDAANRQLRRGNKPVPLPAKAFGLLLTLVENNGRLVGKDELFTSVWRDQIVEESSLTGYVSQIRKALGETKQNPRFIETVPGFGYRFIGDVENLEDGGELVVETETLSRITIEEEVQSPNFIVHNSGFKDQWLKTKNQKLILLTTGALAALLLTLGISRFWASPDEKPENRRGIVPVAAEKQPKIKRLTNKGFVNLAVLSPDGKFFAYSLYERGGYRTEIRLGQTTGNSDVVLVGVSDLVYNPTAFSADGNWLYYVENKPRDHDNGTLCKIPVLGGVPQKLLSGINIYSAISPDESQIAFVQNNRENKTSALVLVSPDGTNKRELVRRPAGQSIHKQSLSWSADGAFIAFSAETGKNGSREVFIANVADQSVTQLTSLNWIELARLEWLKDASGILAVARSKDSVVSTQIWQIDYPAGSARKITRDLAHYGSVLSLSADSGAFIAAQANPETNIWVAPADNLKEARQITFGSVGRHDGWFGIDWLPDGRIIYASRVDQSMLLWTMDADGGNTRQITPIGAQDQFPSATVDEQFVVFESDRSGKSEIWRVGFDGNNLSQLTIDGENSSPSVTADGKWVVYQHHSQSEDSIWRVPSTGGTPLRLTSRESYSPRLSPDGQFIACGYLADGKTKLAIIPATGGEPLKLFDVPPTYNFDNTAIRWSPDGRFISYRDWANGIWQQSVNGGAPKLLEGLPAEKFLTYGWSHDGKQFAFTRSRLTRDAILISDFR